MTEQTEGAEVEALDALAESIVAVLTERQPVSYRPRTAIGEAREVLNRVLASDWLAAREAAAEARGAQTVLAAVAEDWPEDGMTRAEAQHFLAARAAAAAAGGGGEG